jgi:hypothetical protein
VEFTSFLRRFGDGSSIEGDWRLVGEVLAALCMNFMVKSLEDMDFGALPGVLAADILNAQKKIESKRKIYYFSIDMDCFVSRFIKVQELLVLFAS